MDAAGLESHRFRLNRLALYLEFRLSMIFSENRVPPRIKSEGKLFRIML